MDFPIIGTKRGKAKGVYTPQGDFDLTDAGDRQRYYQEKVGSEVAAIKKYLKSGTFIAYMLGKKFAGKGTYVGQFINIFGADKVAHVAVGDLVRAANTQLVKYPKGKFYRQLGEVYRGITPYDEAVNWIFGWTVASMGPTELMLALLKLEITKHGRKVVFIDGLPRSIDQISYSLFFRDLIGYRDDPDLFILIETPEEMINERIKSRVTCSKCGFSRNMKLHMSSKIGYDQVKKEFYFLCDNPACDGIKMVAKEGDSLGIAPLAARLKEDGEVIEKVNSLHGVDRVYLRNSVPVAEADKYFEKYEFTPEYQLAWLGGKVQVTKKPWVFKDDQGRFSYGLLPEAVTAVMIKQMAEILGEI
jgi:adenylate kinase family enzyme